MKLISLDIETTGVKPQEDQIIQIGLVAFDTLWTPKEFIERFKCTMIFIASEKFAGHPVALHMNADKMLMAHKLQSKKSEFLKNYSYLERNNIEECDAYLNKFDNEMCFLNRIVVSEQDSNFKQKLSKILSEFVEDFKNESKSVNITGKNAAGFDMKFIERYVDQKIFSWKRRILDIGTLFAYASDDCIPDLTECMKRCGIIDAMNNHVTHNAMDDAFDTAMCTYLKYQQVSVKQIQQIYEEYNDTRKAIDTKILKCFDTEFNYKRLKETNQL